LNLRILAIQQRWHILFAKNLNSALQIGRLNRITVVIYDRELADADWRNAARRFTSGGAPIFFILLSSEYGRPLWKAVLDNGGYDVAPRNVDSEKLGRVVNGALALACSLDSLATCVPKSALNA
jgi:DNA-binding NarL/FixJ family response regulator